MKEAIIKIFEKLNFHLHWRSIYILFTESFLRQKQKIFFSDLFSIFLSSEKHRIQAIIINMIYDNKDSCVLCEKGSFSLHSISVLYYISKRISKSLQRIPITLQVRLASSSLRLYNSLSHGAKVGPAVGFHDFHGTLSKVRDHGDQVGTFISFKKGTKCPSGSFVPNPPDRAGGGGGERE